MIENIENKGIGEKYKMQYIFSINIMYLLFYLFWLCRGKYSDSNAADEEDPCGSDDCQESENE